MRITQKMLSEERVCEIKRSYVPLMISFIQLLNNRRVQEAQRLNLKFNKTTTSAKQRFVATVPCLKM